MNWKEMSDIKPLFLVEWMERTAEQNNHVVGMKL